MDRDTELNIVRRAYAKQIMATAGATDRRIEAAFAAVRREDFLGRGPWQIVRWDRGYVPSPTRNPVYLYADVVVGILPERNLNNGQPSFLALLIATAALRPGEDIVHIGARSWQIWSVAAAMSPRSNTIPVWRSGSQPIWPRCGMFGSSRVMARRCHSIRPM